MAESPMNTKTGNTFLTIVAIVWSCGCLALSYRPYISMVSTRISAAVNLSEKHICLITFLYQFSLPALWIITQVMLILNVIDIWINQTLICLIHILAFGIQCMVTTMTTVFQLTAHIIPTNIAINSNEYHTKCGRDFLMPVCAQITHIYPCFLFFYVKY